MLNKKLFGKLHVFDLLVFVLIIVLIYFGAQFFIDSGSNSENLFSNNEEVIVTLYFSEVREPTYSNINIDDNVYVEETNKILGKVIDKSVQSSEVIVFNEAGEPIKGTHPEKYDLTLKVKGNAKISGDNIIMGNEIIKIGKQMTIYNHLIESTPVIYGIEETN